MSKKNKETVETVMVENIAEAVVTKRRGRPVVENSTRQVRLAARAARVAAGGEVKRGRPANQTSVRQQKLAERAAKLAQGIVVKRGRPAQPKAEAVAA